MTQVGTVNKLLLGARRVISLFSGYPSMKPHDTNSYSRDRPKLISSSHTSAMQNQQDWNTLITLLDETAREVRKIARQNVSVEQALSELGDTFYELLGSLKGIEDQQDEKHKHEVYANIAALIKDSLLSSEEAQQVSIESCFKAVLIAYEHRHQNPSDPEIDFLLARLKQSIITIRVHYHYAAEESLCKRVTDIFFVRSSGSAVQGQATHGQVNHSQVNHSQANHSQANHGQPVHSQTEEIIGWDSLPAQIRQAFVGEGKREISFQICP